MNFLHRLAIHILVILFGIGSWISLNGVFVETPLLTELLPEGWKFSMYINVISQCANIGPVLFSCIGRCVDNKRTLIKFTIHIVMILGLLSSFLAIFYWNITVTWSNVKHSIPFFILFFCMSLVGCTAVVTFPLYIANFKKQYVTSLVLGENLSGFLPSLVALIQGVQVSHCISKNATAVELGEEKNSILVVKEPNFSVTSFFIFTFLMLLISEISFTILNFWHCAQSEKEIVVKDTEKTNENETTSLISKDCNSNLKKNTIICLLLIQTWIAGLSNTALPSIQSYSSIPFSIFIYHLCATLSNMLSPLGTCLAFIIRTVHVKIIVFLFILTTLISSYIFAMALLSPDPLLKSSTAGGVIMVALWISFSITSSFIKVSIANLFRYYGESYHLGWWGIATQIGSALGAFVIFILVYVADIFTANDPCT